MPVRPEPNFPGEITVIALLDGLRTEQQLIDHSLWEIKCARDVLREHTKLDLELTSYCFTAAYMYSSVYISVYSSVYSSM